MLEVLTYISLIAGGLLVLLLLLSIIGGLDVDFDLDIDVPDADAGGLGLVKGGLTFLSIGAWTLKMVWATSLHPVLSVSIGLAAGLVAVLLLAWFMRLLLRQQEEVNWQPTDALFQMGKVYLRIPESGTGLVRVPINGVARELKAKSANQQQIPTGASVLVEDVEGDVAIVSLR